MNIAKSYPQHLVRSLVIVAVIAITLVSALSVYAASRPSLAPAGAPASAVQPAASSSNKETAQEFQNAMRKLWEEHVTWTRLYIVSAAADLPDKDVTAARLLQNQVDIGNAIKPLYGNAAGDQLTALLKQHILLAAAIIADVKAGNTSQAQTDINAWYANADDIATFLSNANPKNWPLSTMKAQMKMHLDLTLQEASDRLNGKYAADVADYDRVETHILGMADLLSGGIIKQFPQDFTH